MTTFIPLNQYPNCQKCPNILHPLLDYGHLDYLCKVCYQQQQDSKPFVPPVTPQSQPEKQENEKTLEDKPNLHQPGAKDDKGKLLWNLLPWKALTGLVKVLTFGAKKYSPNGWRTVPDAENRYLAALLRHLSARAAGEKIDPESGLRHIDHVLTNATFLAELED